jgi:DNA-3-methyladenine glycosylase II
MKRLDTESDLAMAVEYLVTVEPRFALVVGRHGLPPLRRAEAGLESLLRIVTDQLISFRAGEAIWTRLKQSLHSLEPDAILACTQSDLRALGLSGSKARTFHAAAQAFRDGRFATAHHEVVADEDIMRGLLEIPGVGPWTANIYLMTVVRSADAWPAADLALQRSAGNLLSLPGKPSAREMALLAEAWRPWRSAAALLLWSHYRGLKQMPQA